MLRSILVKPWIWEILFQTLYLMEHAASDRSVLYQRLLWWLTVIKRCNMSVVSIEQNSEFPSLCGKVKSGLQGEGNSLVTSIKLLYT